MPDKPRKKYLPENDKNALEWLVFTLSLFFILGILAYLTSQAILDEPSSPDLVVTHKKDPSPHAPFRYHLTIENKGRETAEEVQIEVILEKDGSLLEVASMEMTYAPKESTREGWVNFSRNPADADTLYTRVVSYKKP